MGSRFAIITLTALLFLLLLYGSPWAQQTICSASGIGVICSGMRKKPDWDLFYHLGGNGPWIPRAPEGRHTRLPSNCQVEQVHMISRHAERFPTRNAGNRHIAVLQKLQANGVLLQRKLAFLKDWKYFTDLNNPEFENLTSEGPYAGTKQAFETGQKLRVQYKVLVNANQTTKFWTCSSERDVETAKHFADGFFGAEWLDTRAAELEVIPEDADRGADTLTPGDTCARYIDDKVYGHDRGYAELAKWQDVFAKPIAERLQKDAGGLAFNPLEVYSMMEMCGFEILARGSSPWCDVFTRAEWLDFEYGRDLLHFYRAGPGNDYAGAMGWLWLNATTALMENESARGTYFSFVHDGDIVPLLATLGILDDSSSAGFLPSDMRKDNRKWKTSDVVPMGGRLVFEKVACNNTGLGGNLRRSYVRVYINDGIVDVEKSFVGGGLAYGVGMKQWTDFVRKKGQGFGSFKEACGLADDAPSRISFLQPQYR